jgi:hypothetical protein
MLLARRYISCPAITGPTRTFLIADVHLAECQIPDTGQEPIIFLVRTAVRPAAKIEAFRSYSSYPTVAGVSTLKEKEF